MKILIVEDQEKLAKSIKQGLEKLGFTADYVLDGETAERRILINHKDYDLIILDLMLPKKDGAEIAKNARNQGIKTPILILTARGEIEDKISLLNIGADDYLVKPFSFEELNARIRALLRRPEQSLMPLVKVGELTLDTNARKVFRNGREIKLTLKEFALLEYLMRHANKVVNREEIYDNLWDFASNSFSNVIDVHIKNLRKKLGFNGNEEILETIRGVGYRLRT